MNSLVTGGAGFIGSHLVDALLEAGHKVAVIDNLSSGKEENIAKHLKDENFIFYKKDICDDVPDIFIKEAIEVVFHLAAIPQVQLSIENPQETHRVNVEGMVNVLEESRKAGVKRFVFSSSSAIYGDQNVSQLSEDLRPKPLSPYALHKLIGEQYCALYHCLYGMQTISFRYFNVYGPRQNPNSSYASLIPKFAQMIRHNQSPTINGDGDQTRDFISVSDVVSANIKASEIKSPESFGQVFNIGDGMKTSVNDIYAYLCNLTGNHPAAIHGPAMIEVRNSLADITKAQQILGWKPNVSLDMGLKNVINFV